VGNSYDFSGRVALITGAASGIGAATATRIREGGGRVASFDLIPAGGVDLTTIGDIADSNDVERAVSSVEVELGSVDILINSAGIAGPTAHTVDLGDEDWERVMAVNATGCFYVCRAVLPNMIKRGYGRIVLLSSITGKEGNPTAPAYSASKAAVIGLTKAIGKDVAGTGVLVNCVAPALIETPIIANLSRDEISFLLDHIPLRRMGDAVEVANLICWLASEDCSFSTGATYDISGGRAVY
jgi:2-dehydro-3-deoxy-L-rhamnonate dehydrogenase (NAD+)